MLSGKHITFILYAISFMDLFAIGLTFPLLNPHIKSLGASHLMVGLIGSSYSALQVVSGPLIGSWSDIRGRKFVMISTLCFSSLFYFLLGATSSVPAIFALRICLGLVKHTQTLLKAIVGDLMPKNKHSEVFGFSSALGSLGFVFGPIIGGHLSEIPHGFFYVCSLTAVLFVLNIGFVAAIPCDLKRTQKIDSSKDLIKNLHLEIIRAAKDLRNVNWSKYWDAFALRFFFGFAITTYFANLSLYLQERFELSQRHIGYTISFYSIVGSGSGLLLGVITKTFYQNDFNGSQRLYHGFVIMGSSLLSLYFSSSLWPFLLFLVPFAVSSSVLRLVSLQFMLSNCLEIERGTLAGASNSIMSIARFISPITSGVIEDFFGANSVMLAAFVPSFIGVLISRQIYKNTLNRPKTL